MATTARWQLGKASGMPRDLCEEKWFRKRMECWIKLFLSFYLIVFRLDTLHILPPLWVFFLLLNSISMDFFVDLFNKMEKKKNKKERWNKTSYWVEVEVTIKKKKVTLIIYLFIILWVDSFWIFRGIYSASNHLKKKSINMYCARRAAWAGENMKKSLPWITRSTFNKHCWCEYRWDFVKQNKGSFFILLAWAAKALTVKWWMT